MKVKNSKYWIILVAMMLSSSLAAQLDQEGFSPVKRDLEVTRVTFDNYLKKWSGDVLLNRFRETTASYKSGQGITILIISENAHIYMNTQGGQFENADGEVMDTFFTDAMVTLQKNRLQTALQKFLVDFKSYLPKLKDNEQIRFVFDVKDQKRKRNGKELPPSKMAHKRTYQLEAKIAYGDFKAFREGSLDEDSFLGKININSNKN